MPARTMRNPPPIRMPAVLSASIAVLAAIHLARQALPVDLDDRLLLTFAFIPARYGGGGAALPGGIAALLWTPITYAGLHADWVHLGVNIVWLASFGTPLARRFGGPRFLVLAVIAAIAGAAAHEIAFHGDTGIVIGASGAISGIVAATCRFAFAPGAALSPRAGGARDDLPAEPLQRVLTRSRALGFILIWFVANILFGLAGDALPGVSGPIAWQAHLGGFIAGLLIFPLLDPVSRVPPAAGDLAPPPAAP